MTCLLSVAVLTFTCRWCMEKVQTPGFPPAVEREVSWGQDGWDGEWVGFSYVPGGWWIYLMSDHHFKEITSLTRGPNSGHWVRKRMCSSHGLCVCLHPSRHSCSYLHRKIFGSLFFTVEGVYPSMSHFAPTVDGVYHPCYTFRSQKRVCAHTCHSLHPQ